MTESETNKIAKIGDEVRVHYVGTTEGQQFDSHPQAGSQPQEGSHPPHPHSEVPEQQGAGAQTSTGTCLQTTRGTHLVTV